LAFSVLCARIHLKISVLKQEYILIAVSHKTSISTEQDQLHVIINLIFPTILVLLGAVWPILLFGYFEDLVVFQPLLSSTYGWPIAISKIIFIGLAWTHSGPCTTFLVMVALIYVHSTSFYFRILG